MHRLSSSLEFLLFMCSNPNSTPTHQPHEHLVRYKLWQVFSHLQSESKSHYYPHFTDKESKTQRREVSCPGCTCPVMTDLIPTQFSLYRTQVSYISPFPTKCHGAKETWVLNWEMLRSGSQLLRVVLKCSQQLRSVSQLSPLPWQRMLVAHQNPSFLSSIVTELLVNTCFDSYKSYFPASLAAKCGHMNKSSSRESSNICCAHLLAAFLPRAGHGPASTSQTKSKNKKKANLDFELPSVFLRLGSGKAEKREGSNLGLHDWVELGGSIFCFLSHIKNFPFVKEAELTLKYLLLRIPS